MQFSAACNSRVRIECKFLSLFYFFVPVKSPIPTAIDSSSAKNSTKRALKFTHVTHCPGCKSGQKQMPWHAPSLRKPHRTHMLANITHFLPPCCFLTSRAFRKGMNLMPLGMKGCRASGTLHVQNDCVHSLTTTGNFYPSFSPSPTTPHPFQVSS